MPGDLVYKSPISVSIGLLACLLSLSLSAFGRPALDTERLIDDARRLRLAERPTWLRLLHFKETNPESLIRSSGFFISPEGHRSPRAELVAMLRGIDISETGDDDKSLRCRFPARYLWLATQLPLPKLDPASLCPRFSAWAKLDQVESVSLMMISGYFGNPASTFGHALLKINNGEFDTPHSLHDLGINYGALVPENESTLAYIGKGIFGGYQAGFSDQDYYRYDLTYSRTEFRDMWEYTLNLSDYQTKLLIYHLWEISGKKFTYYFLKENCAYRLAELLELVTGDDYLRGVNLWYAPISLFQRIRELDAEKEPDERLIKSVKFVPSSQRILYKNLQTLDDVELERINQVILEPNTDLSTIVEGLDSVAQQRVIDSLLAYYQYRLIGQEEDKLPELRRAKRRTVLFRLSLPANSRYSTARVAPMRPPSSGAAPTVFAAGYGYDESGGSQLALRYSLFRYDGIGNNTLHGSELVVLDIAILLDESLQLSINQIDLVRARKMNLDVVQVAGEARQSWEFGLGVRRERNDCRNCNEGFVEGKLGRAFSLSTNANAMAFFGAALATGETPYGIQGGFSAIATFSNRWKTELSVAYEQEIEEGEGHLHTSVSSRYSIAQQHEIRVEVSQNHGVAGQIYYAYHW